VTFAFRRLITNSVTHLRTVLTGFCRGRGLCLFSVGAHMCFKWENCKFKRVVCAQRICRKSTHGWPDIIRRICLASSLRSGLAALRTALPSVVCASY